MAYTALNPAFVLERPIGYGCDDGVIGVIHFCQRTTRATAH